jgi:hypothetical protein
MNSVSTAMKGEVERRSHKLLSDSLSVIRGWMFIGLPHSEALRA